MDIVPTSDGDDDDGVIWYRCPQCQGFLPKLKKAAETEEPAQESGVEVAESTSSQSADQETLEYDSPSAMKAAESAAGTADEADDAISPESDEVFEREDSDAKAESKAPEETEPIQEYAAMLAGVDPSTATPYRPWSEYEVGQCVHHLAWDDCGVVVARETLPGNRNIIKVYFETAGVIRLIEKAPR